MIRAVRFAIPISLVLWTLIICSVAGCSNTPSPSSTMPDGAITQPLGGWVDYCKRHPEETTCPSH